MIIPISQTERSVDVYHLPFTEVRTRITHIYDITDVLLHEVNREKSVSSVSKQLEKVIVFDKGLQFEAKARFLEVLRDFIEKKASLDEKALELGYRMVVLSWYSEEVVKEGLKKIRAHFSFSPSEFARAGFDYFAYQKEEREPICYDHAFYHQHVTELFYAIFSEKEGLHPSIETLYQYLKKNSYIFVQESKPGDLVIYYDSDQAEKLHAGIYLPNGKVISKWGKGIVWVHDLDQVLNGYGDCYNVMRRVFKSPSIKYLFDKISDPETPIAPLSIKTFAGRTFDEHYDAIVPKLLVRSLLGLEYNQYVREEFFKRIAGIVEEEFSRTTVLSIIEEINALPIPNALFHVVY